MSDTTYTVYVELKVKTGHPTEEDIRKHMYEVLRNGEALEYVLGPFNWRGKFKRKVKRNDNKKY